MTGSDSSEEVIELVQEVKGTSNSPNQDQALSKHIPSAWHLLAILPLPFIYAAGLFFIRSGVLELLQSWFEQKQWSYGLSWPFIFPSLIIEALLVFLILFPVIKKIGFFIPMDNFKDEDHPKKEALGIVAPAKRIVFVIIYVILGFLMIYLPVIARSLGAKSVVLEMRHSTQVYQTPATVYYIVSESVIQATFEVIIFFMIFQHRLLRALNTKQSHGRSPDFVQWKSVLGAVILTTMFWTVYRAFFLLFDAQSRMDLLIFKIIREFIIGLAYSLLAMGFGGRFWHLFMLRAFFLYSTHVIVWALPVPIAERDLPSLRVGLMSILGESNIFSTESTEEMVKPVVALFKNWRDIVFSAPMYLTSSLEEKGYAQWELVLTAIYHLILIFYAVLAIRGLKDMIFLGAYSPIAVNVEEDLDDLSDDGSSDDSSYSSEYSTDGYSESEEDSGEQEVVIQDASESSHVEPSSNGGRIDIKE